MAYLDVLTLAETKTYLRVDDTLTDDDARITSMIKATLSMIETKTNILVYARDKRYFFDNFKLRVYDYPINTTTFPDSATVTEKTLYTLIESADTDITLNVGYEDPLDVPNEIKECALEYIKYLYYDSETNNGTPNQIPLYVQNIINELKRFLI